MRVRVYSEQEAYVDIDADGLDERDQPELIRRAMAALDESGGTEWTAIAGWVDLP